MSRVSISTMKVNYCFLFFHSLSYFGRRSEPCCIRVPIVSHIEFIRLKVFSNSSGSGLQGCGLSHSPGAALELHFIKT